MSLQKKGLATVTIAQQQFAVAARAQAKALGLADLPIAVFPGDLYYRGKEIAPEAAARLDESYQVLLAGLTKPVPAAAR